MPAGNYGRSSRTKPFLWQTGDCAAEELERLAERGDAHAQYMMGLLYRDGPLLIPDSRKAEYWFIQAAEHGLPEAQYVLGKLLLSDDLEVHDPDDGIRWMRQAAENGNHFAAYRLGKEYLTGEALTKDTSKAAKWFTQSAEAGNQYAQYMLGKLYLTGQGVIHDPDPGAGLVQPFRRPGKPVRTILPGAAEWPPSTLRHAGGHLPALPHEPDLRGSLPASIQHRPPGRQQTSEKDSGKENRYGPQTG